ncbi:MAG TPA: alpha-L-arabinofuranosidase C-terminal domain-containing protein [Gemmatimonadaceae bacterium]|nr:alpha-L-arabinofuranosidase C-terminal domain-containing protein [Gemmatimonadaceae bacterium]
MLGAVALPPRPRRRRLLALAGLLLLAHPQAPARGQGATPAPATARIVIDAARPEGEISPTLYGQFAEFMFEGVKGGLHAELLRDRGFEEPPSAIGLPRHWERYPDDRNDDYGLAFRWDDSVAYPVSTVLLEPVPVQHALRVDAGAGVVERHGVFQPRVPVRAGVAYRAYLWMRAGDYQGRVVVSLERDVVGGPVYAEAEVASVRGDWRRYDFVLRPATTDPLARLAILFPGRGRLWVDQASLMPDDAIEGVRADVLERVAALRPAFIRWPGGNVAQDYHWQWGVGPRDQRPVWVNLSWRNEPEPGDFGTDEFIAFSRRVGAEPTLTVNVEGRGATPEEAAAWVEYCNGPATSRYGALRAANGHPEPYGVKYWEVGNEIWGDWVRGHSDAATYARNFRRYHDAMRAVDSTIRFIAVGDNDMRWNRTVLRGVGRYMDYLAIHHYYGHDSTQRDRKNLMARPLFFERFYKEVERLAREEVPGRTIRLAINEWGLDLPEVRQHSMEAALYGARLMNVFERSAPLVAMTAVSDLVNGWPGGIIQAGRHGVFVTPLYHANRLYATHLGRSRLRTRVEGPTFDSDREGRGVPYVDAVASRSADGGRIYLKVVNTDPARAIDTRVELGGVEVRPEAEWEVLAADDPSARNSFAMPDAVSPRRERIAAGRRFSVRLPPRSVAVLTLGVAR